MADHLRAIMGVAAIAWAALTCPALAQDDEDAAATAQAEAAAGEQDQDQEPAAFDFAVYTVQLAGAWQGELTYRDFQSNRRETIPLALDVLAAGDGSYVASAATFTDPGFLVYNHSVLQPVGSTGVRVADFGGGEMNVAIREVTSFEATEDGFVVIYQEQGRDNGRAATLQHTETLAGDTYALRRDVRLAGEDDFTFRNEILVSRVD